MRPGFYGLGRVSERPVASQVRLGLRVAAAAASVQLTGGAGKHIESAGRNQRRLAGADVMLTDIIYGETGFFRASHEGAPARAAGLFSRAPLSCNHEIQVEPGGMQLGKPWPLYIKRTGTAAVGCVPYSLRSVFDVSVRPLGPTFCAFVAIWWPHFVR